MNLARKWLYECACKHSACPPPKPAPLPKRILDIGSDGATFKIKLIETQGQHAQYAALSHCWGQAPTFQTKRSTLEARKQNIDWHELPKTFQDSVTVTRNLALKYIGLIQCA